MPELNLFLAAATAAAVLLFIMYISAKRKLAILQQQITTSAQQQFQLWREKELEPLRLQERSTARREATADLEQWKVEYEAVIRRDAIERSKAVIAGQVTEHLIPHMPIFPYNPKDVRFVGSPVDLIVFDGADEGTVREIIFLEIKTGKSYLSQRQKQIRGAIQDGKVVWRELRL